MKPSAISDREEMSLEILISTMNRVDLMFLDKMFKDVNIDSVPVLVINQTNANSTPLISDRKNVRVLNSFEKGLTRSRNLAIQNAKGRLCLFADDDVVYLEGFKNKIIDAFEKHKEADIVTFQMINDNGDLFRPYVNHVRHDKKSIHLVNSVVIAFRRENLLNSQARFDPHFGLGSVFPTANEYVFLRNCLGQELKLYFESANILSHPAFSSGQDGGSNQIIFARAALFYKYYGLVGYLKLTHNIYLLLLSKQITFTQVWQKFGMGLKGIKTYKKLVSTQKQNN